MACFCAVYMKTTNYRFNAYRHLGSLFDPDGIFYFWHFEIKCRANARIMYAIVGVTISDPWSITPSVLCCPRRCFARDSSIGLLGKMLSKFFYGTEYETLVMSCSSIDRGVFRRTIDERKLCCGGCEFRDFWKHSRQLIENKNSLEQVSVIMHDKAACRPAAHLSWSIYWNTNRTVPHKIAIGLFCYAHKLLLRVTLEYLNKPANA